MHSRIHLVVVVACAAALSGCRPLSSHPLAVKTMESVKRSPRVAEVLGQPVECGPAVRGTVKETDGIASLIFDVKGTKAAGVIAVDGKKAGGVWSMTRLELRPAGGDRVSLAAEIETDTPRFDPTAAPATPTPRVAPPAEIEIELPPGS
jgi:hypothetical protein